MNVLLVGAHPDDVETFGGGTAALSAGKGHRVFFCTATNGNVGLSTLLKEEIAAIRRQEVKNAAEIIGTEMIWLDFDDEFLTDSVETRHAFIEAFRVARPDVWSFTIGGTTIIPIIPFLALSSTNAFT